MNVDSVVGAVTDETLEGNHQDRFHSAVTLEPSPALLQGRPHVAVRISHIPHDNRFPVQEVMLDQTSACWTAAT
jgi:hypothetical protein